ncbi:MAG: hypothetical protein ABIR66_06120 [Saprospiraceae bacterium]
MRITHFIIIKPIKYTSSMIFANSVFTYFSGIGFLFSTIWSVKTNKVYRMLSMPSRYDLQQISATYADTGKAMHFLLMDFTSQRHGLNLFAFGTRVAGIRYTSGKNHHWI